MIRSRVHRSLLVADNALGEQSRQHPDGWGVAYYVDGSPHVMKSPCSDRDDCPHLAPACEAPTETGFVNHFIFSSEPLGGDNVWTALQPGEMIGVDWRMRVTRGHV